MRSKTLLLALLFTAQPLAANAQTTEKPGGNEKPLGSLSKGVPVTVNRAVQYDFVSQINGLTYRLMVSPPPKPEAGKIYPVLYVLDGNFYFAAASDSADYASLPAIIVGIGYPTDDFDDVRKRRRFDLTPSVSNTDPDKTASGGGDPFLRVLLEEVRPFVTAHYKTDPARQILYGKSLGGLMVLRQLFRNPTAFNTYIAASPSIWWNDREVLQDEASFSKRAKAGELKLELLISSAGNEQYRGEDAALKAADTSRMIDNASELAARLGALDAKDVSVTYALFPDETHISVSLASLSRALQFALKP